MKFDYTREKKRAILCIDVKSFYASVECVQRGLDPLETMLVVMSRAENTGGLVLAASPKAKEVLGISNVTRKYDLPNHPELKIVSPRMQLYIEQNALIQDIYRQYVTEQDLLIYSIDESFLDVTASTSLFAATTYDLALQIRDRIKKETGLVVTIGIGDNPLLAKLALDIEAKHVNDFISEWHYEDVPTKVWSIEPITEMWGIGHRTAKRLDRLGIRTVYELAQADDALLKDQIGIIGQQLRAHAWGIDRSKLSDTYTPAEKSYGNSQILPYDYQQQQAIEIVIREMADQVAARLRRHHTQTQCVSLFIGYSKNYRDHIGKRGFHQQLKIPSTNNSQQLIDYCLLLFRKNWAHQDVRHVGISYSRLIHSNNVQLDLFQEPEKQLNQEKLDVLIDTIRNKYGYTALVHATSLMQGGTAIERSSLVGGHAGGMDGLQNYTKKE